MWEVVRLKKKTKKSPKGRNKSNFLNIFLTRCLHGVRVEQVQSVAGLFGRVHSFDTGILQVWW